MNSKVIATLAVLMMVFAGVGFVANDSDAADTEGDLTLVINDVYIDDAKGVITLLTGANATVSYIAILDEDFEEKITILTKEYYDKIKGFIKGFTVTVPIASMTDADVIEGLEIFTSVELNRAGDIVGGLSTKIAFVDVLATNVTFDLVDSEDAEAAVAAAVAIVEAFYADYSSPEEVAKAIDDAVAKYKDYLSPEAVEKAKQAAVEQYILDHPVKNDGQIWMIVAIVFGVIAVALGGFTGYKMTQEAKAKKAAKQESA